MCAQARLKIQPLLLPASRTLRGLLLLRLLTRLSRLLTIPRIRIPRSLHSPKRRDQLLLIVPLYIVPPIVENIDDRIIVQPQNRSRVERKPMLQRNLSPRL